MVYPVEELGGNAMPVNIFYFKGSEIPEKVSGVPDAVFSGLRTGLLEGRLVTLSYTNADDEDSRRDVLPEAVYRWNDDWYVSAWCYLRDDKRTFRADRILEAVVTDRKDESHGIAEEIRKNGLPWESFTAPVPEKKDANVPPDPLAESSSFLKPDGNVKVKDIAKWSFARNKLSVTMTNSHLPHIVRRLLNEKNVLNGSGDCRTKLLFAACALLDADCLRKCLKAWANPNFRYHRIYTPVRIAANSYTESASGLFLKAGRILHHGGAHIASDPLVRNIAAVTENARLKTFLKKADVKAKKYPRKVGKNPEPPGVDGGKQEPAASGNIPGGSRPPDLDRFSRELVRDSENGSLEAVREDLVGGADVNYCRGDGRCALHSAARFGFFEICRCLIEHGADVTLRDGCGDTVLISAARSGNQELIRYLVEEKGCDLHARNRLGWTPLYCAVLDNHSEVMRYFIKKGADVNTLTQERGSLLMLALGFSFASPEEKLETARFLMELGVDPNLRDKNGETVLFRAIERNHKEAVELLLKYGVKVNMDNKKGRTPLHAAVAGKYYGIARMLLSYRADPNTGDLHGLTPLMYPILPLEMLQFFVQSGANVNAVTESGKTVLMCHAAPYQTALECGLCTYGLGLSVPGVIAGIDFLLECGADPCAHDAEGNSAAMLAAGSCEVTVRLLEQSGLSVNETNRNGETLLIRAVKSGNFELVRYLVRHRAKKSIRDVLGKTALDHAWEKQNGDGDDSILDIIDFLES